MGDREGPNHPLLRRIFALASTDARSECGKAFCTGTLSVQAMIFLKKHLPLNQASGPSGRSLSRFLLHEASRTISTPS